MFHTISINVLCFSYLGDVIQSDGKNDLNITERETRGKIAVRQITQMLEDLCLGSYYFEVANVLRASLLLSSLLSNSESWYNLSPKDIAKLEAVDESLLRKIFNAHSKTAKGDVEHIDGGTGLHVGNYE